MHCTDVSVTDNETPHRTPIVIWTTVFHGEFQISADGNLFSERRVSVNGVFPYTVNSSNMVDKAPEPVGKIVDSAASTWSPQIIV